VGRARDVRYACVRHLYLRSLRIDCVGLNRAASRVERDTREDPARTDARAIAAAEGVRPAASNYGKTKALRSLTLDGWQQHHKRKQPDDSPRGPFGWFADHLPVARRLSRSALAS
jgi:hypothetical protein